MSTTTLQTLGLEIVTPQKLAALTPKQLRSMWWSLGIARKRGLRIPAADLCAFGSIPNRERYNPVTEIKQIGQFYFVQFLTCASCHPAVDQILGSLDAEKFLTHLRRCPLLERYWFLCQKIK